jgi:hypothetical protein
MVEFLHVSTINERINGENPSIVIHDTTVYPSMMLYVMVFLDLMRYSRKEIFSISMSQRLLMDISEMLHVCIAWEKSVKKPRNSSK